MHKYYQIKVQRHFSVFGIEFWDFFSSALYRNTYEGWMSVDLEFWDILLLSNNIFVLSVHIVIRDYKNLTYVCNINMNNWHHVLK